MCIVTKYASACKAACLEKPKANSESAVLQGGPQEHGPAAKPRVTDTLISLVFPALRCSQVGAQLQAEVYCREAEGGSRRQRGRRGRGSSMKLSKVRTGHPPTPRPSLESRLSETGPQSLGTTVMVCH